MSENKTNIQWFPGHMTKAKRQMQEHLKLVDFVIEIRDARIPMASRNPMLDELTQHKPRLLILSKKDKADKKETQRWIAHLSQNDQKVLALDFIHDQFRSSIQEASQELCSAFIEKQKRRGIKPRPLRVMVCGIHNVGKSTLINSVAKKKVAQTANRPGVTRSLQWIRFGSNIELLDTPGVLWPKFEDEKTGLLLALTGSIRDEVVPMDGLALFACQYMIDYHSQALQDYYQIEIQETPYETLCEIARKRGYTRGQEIDDDRLMISFIKDLRADKCGKITWERVHD